MNFLQLPKPHGFLIWKGKQKAIASPIPILHDRFLTLISEGEAYGDLALAQPAQVSISELERLEEEHRLRPEERKLYYPDVTTFYLHRIKEFKPYQEIKAVHINGSSFEYLDYHPSSEEFEILNKAERLPKIIPLQDDAVVLEDTTYIQEGLNKEKIEPVLRAVLEGAKLNHASLPLYQLALVRIPRLLFKEKKSEDDMPYKVVKKHSGCKGDKPVGVINTDTGELKGCSENEDMAQRHMVALYAAEKKEAPVEEGEKCMDEMIPYGVTSFAQLEAVEQAQETAQEVSELSNQFTQLVTNIMSSPEVMDKPTALKALVDELSQRLSMPMESKSLEGEKAVTKSEGDGKHPAGHYLIVEDPEKPTTWHLRVRGTDGKLDHTLMGAAWAALHGGYRGNKYEGPNKQEAISKLTSLYKSEDMPTPGGKSLEVEEGEKVGKKVQAGMMAKIKAAWETLKEFMDWAEPQEDEEDTMAKGFAFKQINGKPWLITYSTNAFKDREREIFSTKSLEKYVEAAEKQNNRGFYNLWHIPGTDIASIEWQGVVGRFLVEAGPFLETPLGQQAAKFFKDNASGHKELAPEGWGCSPEYRYLPEERDTGVYENIWKTRTSILPRMAAANIWTKTEVKMALSEQQKSALTAIVGDDLAQQIVAGAEGATKELEEAGVAHKGDTETPTQEPTQEVQAEAKLQIDTTALNPFIEAMNTLNEQQNKIMSMFEDLTGRVKSLETKEEVKAKVETPRALLFTQQRASQATETALADDDPLKKMKPVETAQKDKSGAAAFFPPRH